MTAVALEGAAVGRLITRLAQTVPLDLLEMSKRASVLKRVKKNRWLSITSHTQHA